MKKIIFTFAVFSFFVFASPSFAATCGNPSLNQPAFDVFDGVSTTTVPAIDNVRCDNANPLIIMQAWGLRGYETKTVPPGTVITDEAGNSYTCNIRVDSQGCSVLVGLDYYKNQMRAMYKSLVALGIAYQFPQFSYWK